MPCPTTGGTNPQRTCDQANSYSKPPELTQNNTVPKLMLVLYSQHVFAVLSSWRYQLKPSLAWYSHPGYCHITWKSLKGSPASHSFSGAQSTSVIHSAPCAQVGKHVITVWVSQHWRRLPRQVVESPSLEILKAIWTWSWQPDLAGLVGWSWTEWTPEVNSTSTILGFSEEQLVIYLRS